MTSTVYSPDGLTLYTTTTARVIFAMSSDGSTTHWSAYANDSDLSDIAVSPDGWSVRSKKLTDTRTIEVAFILPNNVFS